MLVRVARPAAIVVEPGGGIEVSGTRKRPVVLTCSAPTGTREPSCWNGVRVLGRAPVTRGHFPNDKAATKPLYPAIRNIETNWKAPVAGWGQALNQFQILFEDRLQRVT